MSALGHKQTLRQVSVISALPPKADIYSITSSGCTSSVFGILSPSALADLRLINNSTFVPCWTGRSRGFSPLRIRAAYTTGRTVSVEEIGAIAHQTAGRDNSRVVKIVGTAWRTANAASCSC